MRRLRSLALLSASALPILLLPGCAGTVHRETSVPSSPPTGSKTQPAGAPGATATGARPGEARGRGAGPVVLAVPDDPTLSVMVWFQVGSQDDPPGKEGLAYVTAQLLADGATTANAYEVILEKLYPISSGYGVRVDKEMTVLSGRTHRDNIDLFLPLFTDAYLRPAFDAEDFERVRSRTLNYVEKTLRYASDEELGKAALHGTVFEGTRYAHPPQGTESGLKAITLDDVRTFFRTRYTRDRAVVALGGATSPSLVSRLEATVQKLPAAAAQTAAPTVAPASLDGRKVVLVSKPGADASISFGFPIDVPRGTKDFYALWIANSWLGEHRNQSSHLYQVIREARGLNYGDYSYIEAYPEGGQRSLPPTNVARRHQIFEVWIRTLPNAQGPFALRAAMRELTALLDRGMTQEDFDLTRDFLGKYILHFAPTSFERLGYAVDDRFYGIEGEGHLARFRTMLKELTLEDVNAALRRHLQVDRMAIAIVTGDAEAMKVALTSGDPTPIQYASPKSAEIVAEDAQIAAFPTRIRPEAVKIVPVEQMFD